MWFLAPGLAAIAVAPRLVAQILVVEHGSWAPRATALRGKVFSFSLIWLCCIFHVAYHAGGGSFLVG